MTDALLRVATRTKEDEVHDIRYCQVALVQCIIGFLGAEHPQRKTRKEQLNCTLDRRC